MSSSSSGRRYLLAAAGLLTPRSLKTTRRSTSPNEHGKDPTSQPPHYPMTRQEFDFDAIDKHGRCLLQWDDVDGVAVVRFRPGQLREERNTQNVFEELYRLLGAAGRHRLLLDFKKTEVLRVCALGKLVTLYRKVQHVNGRLALCGIDLCVYELFEITKLNKLFAIYRDEQVGLQRLTQA